MSKGRFKDENHPGRGKGLGKNKAKAQEEQTAPKPAANPEPVKAKEPAPKPQPVTSSEGQNTVKATEPKPIQQPKQEAVKPAVSEPLKQPEPAKETKPNTAPSQPPKPAVVSTPAPKPEVQPQATPQPPATNTTVKERPTGAYITGELPYLPRWAFTNDSGKQDFSQFFDPKKSISTAAWHTDYGKKVFNNPNMSYFAIPRELDATITAIKLGDGTGDTKNGPRFHAILDDASYTLVKDIIPQFTGKGLNTWIEFKTNLGGKKIRAIVMETPTIDQIPTITPSGIRFYGTYKDVRPVQYKRRPVPFENFLGAVCYPSNLGDSRGLRDDKSEMLKKLHLYRMYFDEKNAREKTSGLFTFEPTVEGGWLLDTYFGYMHSIGKEVMICPQGNHGMPHFPELCKQIAIRYGSNKNVPDSEVKIFSGDTNTWQGEKSRNVIKKGLGFVRKIQLGNEPQPWWKGRADLKNQVNTWGFITPFELAAIYDKCYQAIKSADPNMEVVCGGLAASTPGYLVAMDYYSEVYLNGRRLYDSVSYHDYPNAKGSQRAGVEGLPPEMTTYRDNAETILQAMSEVKNPVDKAYVTETGYSISQANPEQAVKPVGKWNEFEVQGFYIVRIALESARAGLSGVTFYQMYDDSMYVRSPGSRMNWDLSNGIADRNTNDIHKPRPATNYTSQLLSLLSGYVMTEPAKAGSAVYVDKFEKAGSPAIYAVTNPVNTAETKNFVLNLNGAKSIDLIELVSGADAPKVSKFDTPDGKLNIVASLKPVFVRVRN